MEEVFNQLPQHVLIILLVSMVLSIISCNMLDSSFIYIMLVHDYNGIFKSYVDRWASNAEWRSNPYIAANGRLILNGLQLKSEKDMALWLKPLKKIILRGISKYD